MPIHHATQKRAHNQGLHIEEEHDGYGVYRAHIEEKISDEGVPFTDVKLKDAMPMVHSKGSAKDALATAEVRIVEDGVPDKVLEDDEDDEKSVGSIVKSKYKERYVDGNNGDEIATEASAYLKVDGKFSLERYEQLCSDNDIDNSKWADLNNGQKSMNVRNKLRAQWRSGEDVQIGDHTVPGKEQDENDAEEAA